jgi:hypothetical protein
MINEELARTALQDKPGLVVWKNRARLMELGDVHSAGLSTWRGSGNLERGSALMK